MNKEISKPDTGPIGTGNTAGSRGKVLRRIAFAVVLLYVLIAVFHVRILTSLGRFLVVEQTPSKSDLIVCLAGGNIERGLGAAELYRKGFAPRIFISPEEPPDGLDLLREKGIEYPQTIDLFITLLQKLDVPRSAILKGDGFSGSTIAEARMVGDLMMRENYHSLILVTSPSHSRRAYLTFKKVLEDQKIRVQVFPTPYSNFRAEEWWRHRKYMREVILEYQKLVYYYLKEFR